MGTYYKWICKAKREEMSASGLLGAEDEGRYGSPKLGGLPGSAWAIAALCLDRWKSQDVTLVNDGEWDEDDEMACGGRFTDVSVEAAIYALRQNLIPDEELKKMAWAVGANASCDIPPGEARAFLFKHFADKVMP